METELEKPAAASGIGRLPLSKGSLPAIALPPVPKLALYSAVPPQPLLAQFDAGFIASPEDRGQLQREWTRCSKAYSMLCDPARSSVGPGDVRKLVGVGDDELQTVLDRARLYPPFDSHPPEVVAVRLSKLVTPQLTVSLPRAGRRARVSSGASDAELLAVSASPSSLAEPIHRQVLGQGQNQGAVLFTSYDEDVRPHPPTYRELGLEPKDHSTQVLPAFCLPVGGGIPFIFGYRITIQPGFDRIIIANGIHRAYSIAKAGCDWLPLILCRLAPVEMPPQLVELPSPLVLDPSSNPPLLTDFLNDSIAMKLDYFPVLKIVRINWSAEQYATVLR